MPNGFCILNESLEKEFLHSAGKHGHSIFLSFTLLTQNYNQHLQKMAKNISVKIKDVQFSDTLISPTTVRRKLHF